VVGFRALRRPRINLVIVGALGLVALIQGIWVVDRAINHPGAGMLGDDFDLYIDATRRWLGGGSFYHAWQLAGPYDVAWGQILYPPHALALFVPFVVLGGPLFVLVPALVTLAMIWWHRPRPWAWGAIFLVLIAFPLTLLPWVSGTPTIWMIAIVALSTRWAWMSALIWLKPSIFPFALVGMRDPRWWALSGAVAISAWLMWPLTLDWITVVWNARGQNSGIFYSLSLGAVAGPLIPIIAAMGSGRSTTRAGHSSSPRA
jgi:hypothetical protein